MSTGAAGPPGPPIAHLYVHTNAGAIYDFSLRVLEEFVHGGTFVDSTGQGIANILNRNDVTQIRLFAQHLVFTIEAPEDLHPLLYFSTGAGPLKLNANYGTKVTIAHDGPGLKFDVTPKAY